MSAYKISIARSNFALDSLLNIVSVFLLGVSGILINVVIARFYTARDLGIFNQVYAIYVLFSQLAAGGVQVSALKHVAQYWEDKVQCDNIINAGFYLCIILATVICLLLFYGRNLIGNLLKSPDVAMSLKYILPGLWCFALNKLFFGILNGFEHMKAYALFSSLRALGLLLGIMIVTFMQVGGIKLPVIFSISEIIVLITIFIHTKNLFSFVPLITCIKWIRTHIEFGAKSLGVGLITELNTRVDIIILGIFASDRVVGIYSLAAMLIEGLYQLPYVFRKIIDPKLTKLIYNSMFEEIQKLIRKGSLKVFMLMLPIYGFVTLMFPFVVKSFTDNLDFASSWKIFTILIAGATVQSSYIPFSGLLVQGGYPGFQSLFILLLCLTNIILNFVLIPIYGMYGAAIATTISFICFVLYLKLFAYNIFKIKI